MAPISLHKGVETLLGECTLNRIRRHATDIVPRVFRAAARRFRSRISCVNPTQPWLSLWGMRGARPKLENPSRAHSTMRRLSFSPDPFKPRPRLSRPSPDPHPCEYAPCVCAGELPPVIASTQENNEPPVTFAYYTHDSVSVYCA